MLCEVIIEIRVKHRTYENTFKEAVPLEEEGMCREDLDPEGIIILCEDCGKRIYPLDWVRKDVSHGKVHLDTLSVNETECVRCLASTRKLLKKEDCIHCKSLSNKNKKF